MCTSVILFRKEHNWPLIIGSNRDESFSRKSLIPARHWPKLNSQIVGGYDIKAKGTWCAINEIGILAIIHNKNLKENNNIIKQSRGNIILNILNSDKIEISLKKLQNLNQQFFNGFNILLADKSNCFWGKHESVNKKIEINEINEGLSILTDKDINDINDRKINFYLNKFSQAPLPNPTNNNWLSWELLLATDEIEDQKKPEEAICINNIKENYGTKSSSILALSNTFLIKKISNNIIFRYTEDSPIKSNFIDYNFLK